MLMKGGNIPKDEKVLSSKRSDFVRLAKDTMMIHEKDGLRIVCLLDLMARQVTDTPLSDEEKKKELMLQ